MELPIHPWTDIFVDYVIDLPKCLYNGKTYKYIFVVVDRLMKIKYFILITSLDIKEFIKAFTYTVYKLYNILSTIISNKSFLFIFDLWRHLNQYLKIALSPSSV